MSAFETTMISILVMIFLGYILKRIDLLKSGDVETLNKLVINIAMPCMIFKSLYGANLSILPKLAIMPTIGLGTSVIIGGIVFLLCKFKDMDKVKTWTLITIVTMGNTAFLGFPVILGIYGNPGLLIAIFSDVASVIFFLILSFVLMIVFGGSIKSAIKKIATFPPLWALILGISCNLSGLAIGLIPTNIVGYLSGAAIPLIMISLGLSLNLSGLKWNAKAIGFTSIVKLAIYPAIALILVHLIGLHDLQYTIAIIEAAMPSGMLTLVLALNYKLDVRMTSDCIFSNNLFSLISIPIIIGLL